MLPPCPCTVKMVARLLVALNSGRACIALYRSRNREPAATRRASSSAESSARSHHPASSNGEPSGNRDTIRSSRGAGRP
jgi:hypothetical protein